MYKFKMIEYERRRFFVVDTVKYKLKTYLACLELEIINNNYSFCILEKIPFQNNFNNQPKEYAAVCRMVQKHLETMDIFALKQANDAIRYHSVREYEHKIVESFLTDIKFGKIHL